MANILKKTLILNKQLLIFYATAYKIILDAKFQKNV